MVLLVDAFFALWAKNGALPPANKDMKPGRWPKEKSVKSGKPRQWFSLNSSHFQPWSRNFYASLKGESLKMYYLTDSE